MEDERKTMSVVSDMWSLQRQRDIRVDTSIDGLEHGNEVGMGGRDERSVASGCSKSSGF